MSRRISGYLSMALAATTWGSIPVIVRRADAPAALLVAMRMGFGALALAAFVVAFERSRLIPRASRALLLVLGVVLAVNWVAFFRALALLPGASAVLIVYVFPIAVALVAPVVLDEARERHVLPLAVAGFGGLAMILAPQVGGGRVLGALYALAGAATSVVLVTGGRRVVADLPPAVVALWQNVVGCLLLLPFAVHAGVPHVPWRWGVLLGVVHTAATGVLFFRALQRIPAQEAGVLMYLEPVSAVGFAWAFLAQRPSGLTAAGGLVVIAAGATMVVLSGRSEQVPLEGPGAV